MGIDKSKAVHEITRRQAAAEAAEAASGSGPLVIPRRHEQEGDDESEEPEDDEMDIEQLQVTWAMSCFWDDNETCLYVSWHGRLTFATNCR